MPTLHKYLHVIVFVILLALMMMLNFGPFAVGWPFPIVTGRPMLIYDAIVHLVVNAIPCMMVMSLCMIPFAYDSQRSFSTGSILLFTTSASLGFLLLKPSYLAYYQTGEHLLIITVTAMAMNGLMCSVVRFLNKYVDLPQWRNPERANGNEPPTSNQL